MRLCERCGKEIGIGTYSLVSNLCDECYEKVHYYTPDFEYHKEYIENSFALSLNEFSVIDLVMFISSCEEEVYSKIKEFAKNRMPIVVIFREFEIGDKLKELIINHKITLSYSYFFTDNLLGTVPCFEDRKKYRSVIIVR